MRRIVVVALLLALCGCAAPAENGRRERPEPGDVVILLGGRTGRDGCGGATGSSKTHNLESLTTTFCLAVGL